MGLFDGLPAFPLTPADRDGRVDEDALARLVGRIAEAGAGSIGLLGSTGVYMFLSGAERRRAVEAVAGRTGGVPLIVGVGAMRTDAAAALAVHAREAGADGLLLAPVSYTPLSDEEVYCHFAAVAEAGGLPLCIYNNPGTTHFHFGEELIARLAHVPRIAAVKMPLPADGDVAGEVRRIRAASPEGFAIGYSGDWGMAEALLAGADAFYSVIAGILPEAAQALATAAGQGDVAEVRRIDAAFAPLWDLFRRFGSLRVVYAIAELLELGAGAPPLPLRPLPDRAADEVRAALSSLVTAGLRPG